MWFSENNTQFNYQLYVKDATNPGHQGSREAWETDCVELFMDSDPLSLEGADPKRYNKSTLRHLWLPRNKAGKNLKVLHGRFGKTNFSGHRSKPESYFVAGRFKLKGNVAGFAVKIDDAETPDQKAVREAIFGKGPLWNNRCLFMIAVPAESKNTPVGSNEVPAWRKADIKFDFEVPANIRPILYRGADFQKKETEVFAWIGLPEKRTGKVPGVVLVHGGGGSAFLGWVKHWTERGYAAIAMDNYGSRPSTEWGHANSKRLPNGGPNGVNYKRDIKTPSDSWNVFAVEAIRRAHSLLRSLPEVDAEKTAVIGTSWGGYLTCFAAASDNRYKAAVSVYGCGYLPTHIGKTVAKAPEEWHAKYNPMNVMANIKCPFLMMNLPTDVYYLWTSWTKSSLLPANVTRSMYRFSHSHKEALRKEVNIFIDSVLKDGTPLPGISLLKREGEKVSAEFKSEVPIVKAELWWNDESEETADSKRKWKILPAKISENTVSAELPAKNAVKYYLNITDQRGAVATSIQK